MATIVYHIPLTLVAAYRGRKVIVRSQAPMELVRGLPESDRENLVGVQLLSLTTDADALANWGETVPVELAMFHPETEFPLLYRHAKLLDKHPMRVAIPVVPGFSNAVKIATSLQFRVKLEVDQPDPATAKELCTVLDFYLHHSSVSQPVEYFHSTLLSFYHREAMTLWDIQEENPAILRYVTDEGKETVARRLVHENTGNVETINVMRADLEAFLPALKADVTTEFSECSHCEFFANCGGYFKWPRKEYPCDGVKAVFRTLREAAEELAHDLTAFFGNQNGGRTMIGSHFSVILLPTNKCNVACEYCFEDKTNDVMSLEQVSVVIEKLLDHMERKAITALTLYWQGEIMLLPPHWFERARELIHNAATARGKHIHHSLQSNMIGYSRKWNTLIANMFGNSVGTSMDFPNLYRKAKGRTSEEYTAMWTRNVRAARDAGIAVGVIAIPNKETLRLGAERFYSYFVDELQISDFQVNTSFSGGEANAAKQESLLDLDGLSQFFVDLSKIWVKRGYEHGVKLSPLDELMNQFTGENACLPCIWRQNCADEFVSIDARGYVAQCDCWVTSYPDYWFGNIFDDVSFTELLQKSQARQRFQARPEVLMQTDTCVGCDYLSVCHGGCPVRTYAITGQFFRKDPYCQVYKALFSTMEELAAQVAAVRSRHASPLT